MKPVVLEAEGLVRKEQAGDRELRILDGVSLALHEAEFLTVMGPSGSGKSSLLHCLSGMEQPQGGRIRLASTELGAVSEKERTELRRRFVGFVFQFFNLLPDLSVQENVELPLRIAGDRPERYRDRTQTLLATLGLADLVDRQPHALSGGEMQRVSIARALVARPPILMADEPTGNLSSRAGEETMRLFGEIRERFGTAVLLVTHNPRDAACGDRVLFLQDGCLDPSWTLEGPGLDAAAVHARLEELGI